ncbi:MAG: thioredoxin [bacterium]
MAEEKSTKQNQEKKMAGKNVVYLSDAEFQEKVINSDKPVLVDFYADWCGPCKMIGPILEDLADEFVGKVTIAKLNVDQNSITPSQFGVRGIPTMILFENGKQKEVIVGADPGRVRTVVAQAA